MSLEQLPKDAQDFIARAAQYLEKPSFLMKLANLVGKPVEVATTVVPGVPAMVEKALQKTMDIAIRSVPQPDAETTDAGKARESSSGYWHKWAAAGSGAIGGLMGAPGLAVELPVTTGIMFRSIAAIAADFGEDLAKPETRLECLSVFSYGGPTPDDSSLNSTYITTRLGLTMAINQATQTLTKTSAGEIVELFTKGAAPALMRLVSTVAARFNFVVSEKLLAQSVPIIGALGGAFVNVAFTDHFNTVALYHFGIRRLEREHGTELVQAAYREAVGRGKVDPSTAAPPRLLEGKSG